MKANETFVLTHDEIAARAKKIWFESGCIPEKDKENWLLAESQLKAEAAKKSSAKAKKWKNSDAPATAPYRGAAKNGAVNSIG